MQTEKRPKIKPEFNLTDYVLEIVGWCTIIMQSITAFKTYSKVQDEKTVILILILTLLSVTLYVGLTILNKFPHIFNYPTKITNENALKKYTSATRLIRYFKLIVVLYFAYISYDIIGDKKLIGMWMSPLFIALIFIPLSYLASFFIKKSNRSK